MRHLPSTLFLFVATATHAGAQIIEIPTVPVRREQLKSDIPSVTRSMGHISIAVRDELTDPFVNPADIMHGAGTTVFLSPGIISWSQEHTTAQMSARGNVIISAEQHEASVLSASAGIVHRTGATGMAALAGLQLHSGEAGTERVSPVDPFYNNHRRQLSYHGRRFPVMVAFAGTLPESKIALGGSFAWTSINGNDEIRLRSGYDTRIEPAGNQYDARFGAALRDGAADAGLVVGYSSINLDHGPSPLITHTSGTWLARMKYRMPLSDQVDIGVQATVNRMQHRRSPHFGNPRTTTTAYAFDIGIGSSWKRPWGMLALEYLIEPVSSVVMFEHVDFVPDTEGRLVEGSSRQLAQVDMMWMHHVMRAGLEFGILPQTTLRLGSQARTGSLAYSCTNNVGHMTSEEKRRDSWTLACTGGVDVELGVCRLNAGAEILLRHNVPGPVPPATSWPRTPEVSCDIPADPLTEPSILTGRLALIWTLGAE